jgi:hypothetical protein
MNNASVFRNPGEVFYRAYGSTFEHTSTRSFTISVSRLYSGRKLEGWAYTNDATGAFSGCTAGAALAELSCSGVLLAEARRTNAVSKISLRVRFFRLWARCVDSDVNRIVLCRGAQDADILRESHWARVVIKQRVQCAGAPRPPNGKITKSETEPSPPDKSLILD